MGDNNIYMYRSNNKTVRLTVFQSDGSTVYALTNCVVTMYIKRKASDLDDEALITKTATLTDAANGKCEFYFIPADTSDEIELKDNKPYYYHVKVRNNNYSPAKYYTAVKARFIIFHA